MGADLYEDNKGLDKNQTLEVLEKVADIIQQEAYNDLFYNYLISEVPTDEEEIIIESIKKAENKNKILFSKIYKDIAGIELPEIEETVFENPKSYLEGIKRVLFRNLLIIDKCTEIMEILNFHPYKDILLSVSMSGIKHFLKYNYIYILNNAENPQIFGTFNIDRITPLLNKCVEDISPLVDKVLSEFNKERNI